MKHAMVPNSSSPLHSSSSGADSDREARRRRERAPAILAVELSSKEKPKRCGITRNASGNGLLIVTPSRFSVGDELELSMLIGDAKSHASARVVRVEENGWDSAETWRYRLAVELDGALSEDLLAEARARVPFAKAG
jgi:hypothetical protein